MHNQPANHILRVRISVHTTWVMHKFQWFSVATRKSDDDSMFGSRVIRIVFSVRIINKSHSPIQFYVHLMYLSWALLNQGAVHDTVDKLTYTLPRPACIELLMKHLFCIQNKIFWIRDWDVTKIYTLH